MSRSITRPSKTIAKEAQEEEEYREFKRQWEIDQESRRAGTKEKPTPEEMDKYYAAERASHMRQMYPTPRFGGVDRGFAGGSERHKKMLAIQASNRGKEEVELLAELRKKLGIAIERASAFIETTKETLDNERERWELLVGMNDENLDRLLEQIAESQTWNVMEGPKPKLIKRTIGPEELYHKHDRLALKTYIIDNRRISDFIREYMNGGDMIRKMIRELAECRDGGLKFMADIDSDPTDPGRDNADGISIPQLDALLDYQRALESKLSDWLQIINKYTKTDNGSLQLTFKNMVTYRENWKEMRKAEIREKIEADRRAAAERQQVAKHTYAPVRHSDGVLRIRRDRSPAARGPPAHKNAARNPDPSPAARGPPREGDKPSHDLDEGMRNLFKSTTKTPELRKTQNMHALLLELKAS
jgi:hypothetical protein